MKAWFRRFCKLLYLCFLLISLIQCSPSPQFSATNVVDTNDKNIPSSVIISQTTKSLTPEKITPPPTMEATASLLIAQKQTPSPHDEAISCDEKSGEMQRGSLITNLLRQPLEFRVYLPPCYKQQRTLQYPVLYLIHGQSYSDDQWDRLGADETADRLISQGKIPPLIIVMPRDRNWDQPQIDLFGEAVIEILIPYIDAKYRTLTERPFRAIGGLSRGAGWALHLGFSHWQYFGAIGAHSLPVFKSDAAHISTWIDSIPFKALPRIYIDIGDKDRPAILSSAIWFEKILTEKNVPHEWHLNIGYHDEAYWSSHLEQYLTWYTQDW